VEVAEMLSYSESATGVRSDQLAGFFVGWPNPPTPERHLDMLRGSDAVALAIDDGTVVGYATAISDGVLAASIPFLEVLPAYQHQGIGTELVRRLLAQLEHLYMVDVSCDAELETFYRRLGFGALDRGMGLRRRENI
jgi:ribosomal protein S18 acetylase RimI-like enzyme